MLKLNACQRLIVGWDLEYCQYFSADLVEKPIKPTPQITSGLWPTLAFETEFSKLINGNRKSEVMVRNMSGRTYPALGNCRR